MPAACRAQDRYTYSVGLFAGLGGSIDQSDAGFGNGSYQLLLGVVTGQLVRVRARIGAIGFGSEDVLGDLADPSFRYATLAGEYRFDDGHYQSGLFLGVGGYDISGRHRVTGSAEDETTFGFTGGVNGEWRINRKLSVEGELAAHYVLSDFAEFFAAAFAGITYHIK